MRTPRLVLLLVACSGEPPRVDDSLPPPIGLECTPGASSVCTADRPTLAIAAPADQAAASLFVAAGVGELHRVRSVSGTFVADRVGWVSSHAFADQSRLMTCDIDGDGAQDVVYSEIDALAGGYVVWGDAEAHGGLLGQRTVPERLQAARCLDVDDDGHADLVGLVDAERIGVLFGSAAGVASTPLELPVAFGDAALFPFVVAAAGDVDGDGVMEWIWTTVAGSQVTTWSLPPGTGTVDVRGTTDLGSGERVLGLELADVDGDFLLDLVIRSATTTDGGRILVARSRGDGGFLPPVTIEFQDRPRRVWAADVDEDGSDELVVVGGWNDGVGVLDLAGDELVLSRTFEVLAADALPLQFDEDASWDLAVLRADTWEVELLRNALAGDP